MQTQNILTFALLGVIAYSGYKIYTLSKSKRIGDSCSFDSGPDGVVVYTYDQNEAPTFKCRRCNPTGCASYTINKKEIGIYGK
jgi:hypothetical protein